MLSGSGTVKLDDEIVDVKPMDAVRVAPGTMRAFAAGPDGLELLAFGGPTAPESDAVMVQGWWSE